MDEKGIILIRGNQSYSINDWYILNTNKFIIFNNYVVLLFLLLLLINSVVLK